jgi:hypothetical protein
MRREASAIELFPAALRKKSTPGFHRSRRRARA